MTTINVALCAYGLSGKVFHQPFIKVHPGFHLQGVLERTKNESIADNPHGTIYRSLDDLLADASIDLVVVNTPNYTHYEYAARALQAGKHVIVEKPFTPTVNEAMSLLKLAGEQRRFITVYHNRRYDADFLTVKKVVDGCNLGDIIEAEFRFERYRDVIGPKPFKEEPVPGSGFLYDLGAHLADAAVALFGKPHLLFADCRKVREGSAVDDFFEIILFYDKVKRIRLLSGQVVRHPLPAFTVHGTKGSFIMERIDKQEELLMGGKLPVGEDWSVPSIIPTGLLETETENGTVAESIPASTGNYMAFYDAVYDAIVSGKPFPISAENIVDVIGILEASEKSSELGKVVEL
jgi:predicted dehydrogenase